MITSRGIQKLVMFWREACSQVSQEMPRHIAPLVEVERMLVCHVNASQPSSPPKLSDFLLLAVLEANLWPLHLGQTSDCFVTSRSRTTCFVLFIPSLPSFLRELYSHRLSYLYLIDRWCISCNGH
ncbi:hypothetical protein J6590_042983 [Homalodisca vitripennis]|nr:hypothetical protein J6590_042983 [Homalodisca vitripennis]